jgi:O-antigen/teichoic acid export membrane protein
MFNLKFSKVIKDVHWSFISLATSAFAHLLLRIILGNELGPSGLGLYTLVFTIYMFGMQFSGFGIGQAMIKYVAEYHDNLYKIKEFVSSGIVGSIVSGSLMGLLLYISSKFIAIQLFHNPEMTDLLKITALCFPFIAIEKAVISIQIGLREMKSYALINVAQNVFVVVLSIALVTHLNMDVRGSVIGFVLPTILVGLSSLFFIKKYLTAESSSLKTTLKEVSRFGFYVVLTNSIGLINTQTSSLMIGHFMNETEVGYYAVAAIFIEGLYLIPSSIETVTDARIVRYHVKKEDENLIKLVKSNISNVFVITVLESLALVFFGKFLIERLFGVDFLPAYQPLLILLIGYCIFYPIQSISGFLPCIGKVELLSKISFLCAAINILLNILLVPNYGMTGAAVATTTALIFSTLVRYYFTTRYMPKSCSLHFKNQSKIL